MSVFSQVKQPTENVQAEEDYVGGSKTVLPTDIYEAVVKQAYIVESKRGALGVVLTLTINGEDITETSYVTNANKEITYKDKKTGEPRYMPSYSILNSLSLLATGKTLLENDTPKKTLMLWDYESKKEIPKEVPVLEEFLGKEVKVAVEHVIEPANVKNDDGDYVPKYSDTGELVTYTSNKFVKFYRFRDNMTTNEIVAELDEPVHYPAWLEKNKGVVKDKTADIPKTVTSGAQSGKLSTNKPVPSKSSGTLFK